MVKKNSYRKLWSGEVGPKSQVCCLFLKAPFRDFYGLISKQFLSGDYLNLYLKHWSDHL